MRLDSCNMDALVDELALTQLDPVTHFMLSNNFPEHESLEFYQKMFDMLCVIGLNMYDTRDMRYVDGLAILTARKIKKYNQPELLH